MNKITVFIIFFTAISWFLRVEAEDLTLQEAVREASQMSPRLQKSRSSVEQASWKRVETYSGFLPTLSASASYLTAHKYVFTDITFGGAPTSVPGIIPTSNLFLTAQLPLFDGFASTHRWQSAKSFERSAEADLHWTEFQVDRDVTLQFYRALAAQILREVAEQNVKTLEDHLHDVGLFKKAGLSTNYDVLRVEVQVSEAKTELLNAVDNAETGRNRLGEILGRETEERVLRGRLPVLSVALAKSASLEVASSRKDIQALHERAQGFDELKFAAAAYWLPKVGLFGQYQYYNNRNDEISDRENFREAYQVGVNLTWNLFDGMISQSRSRQSIEEKAQAEATLRMAQLRARQDFELWKRKFIYFCSVYASRLNDVEKASESVRLAREGRKVGSRTNTDLLDAETELFRARAGVVNAQLGSVEALINLELSTGQKLYEFN